MNLRTLKYFFIIFTISICGVKEAQAQEKINVDEVIKCLNSKIISYNIGVSQLHKIQKTDTIISSIDTTNKILIRSFDAINNYNKLKIKLKIDYYYSNDLTTIKKLENVLLNYHNLEIKKIETEYIVRVENLIISVNVSKKFEGSYIYLKNTIFNLVLDYINFCKN